jgi:FkbH-like protein
LNIGELSIEELMRSRRRLRRELSALPGLQKIRIAVLGGSTTNELVDLWELLLLASGFEPTFQQSEYGLFYEEAVHNTQALADFKPDIVYVHTSYRNVQCLPAMGASETDFDSAVAAEVSRYRQIWDSLSAALPCQIVQNNFELPPYRLLGNLEPSSPSGSSRFFLALNAAFAAEARQNPRLLLHDLFALAAYKGGENWFDFGRWFGYKLLYTTRANYEIARSLTALTLAIYGRSRKVLVLDLDNTCWGGVIGDDGVDRIQIGREHPEAEAYTAFQEYCLRLRDRGVLLAVCSKNDDAIARQGFGHPDSVLKLEHFSSFKANWNPKHENLQAIAAELQLGLDSFVFVDDNPAERAIVSAQLPEVAVPDVGNDVVLFPKIIDAHRYFEPITLSVEDVTRASLYAQNAERAAGQAQFATYGEYLDSLEMKAEIAEFQSVYMERITQLTNKTNQFNLTTRRYTQAEIESIAADLNYIGLYGRLLDRFGDNGLVSVVLARRVDRDMHIDLWLMSCRVLKRDMEHAMLDALVERAIRMGVDTLHGTYIPTNKNSMVADHYSKLGFVQDNVVDGQTETHWTLDVTRYTPQNLHINILDTVHA